MNFKEIDEARKMLDLGETATMRDIKDAYRRLALKYHPDRCEGGKREDHEAMFKKITVAHETIMSLCAGYRYSFKKQDIQGAADSEMDEEFMEKFYGGWLVDL